MGGGHCIQTLRLPIYDDSLPYNSVPIVVPCLYYY
jgi:hypothetical protein